MSNTEPNVIPENNYYSQLLEYERLLNENAEKGDYEKAESYKKKIKEIKILIKKKRKKELEKRQLIENENLESNYKTDLDELNQFWNDKFKDYEEKTQKAEEEIIERQNKEMNDLYNLLEQEMNQETKYRPSAEYLKLENQEKQLVKLQRFNEASVVRKKKEQIKVKDIEKKEKEKQLKIQKETSYKNKRHELEKEILKKKFEKELEEMKIKKIKDFERIEKKFSNKRLDLSQQQKTEINFNENGKISPRRNVRGSYSAFQNNFGTTTDPSKINIYNNTNNNTNNNFNNNIVEGNNESEVDNNKENIDNNNNLNEEEGIEKINSKKENIEKDDNEIKNDE